MASCKNVGRADRAMRALIGVGALALAFTTLGAGDGAILGIAAAVLGVVMLATAAAGFCPLYWPIKLSTCRVAPK